MKRIGALAGVTGSPLLLGLLIVLPKLALLFLTFFPAGLATVLALVSPILIIGILPLFGIKVPDAVLFPIL